MEQNLQKKKQELKTNKQYTEEQLEREYKIELFFYNLPQLILVFACVFLVAYIFNKYLEAITFLLTFFIMRYTFNTTFHYENVLYCILTTIALFTLSVVFSPPITISLFGSSLFGFLDTWALWFIQDRFDHKLNAQLLEVKVKELLEQEENPKDKLLKLCAEKGISERDTKIAVMYYIERMKPKQIWDWLCETNENMEYASVYKLINRLNKKINDKN